MSSPPPYIIKSHNDTPNRTQFTQLEIDHERASATFKYFKSGQMLDAMSADISGLFIIRFSKFDLRNGKLFWGHVEYRAQEKPDVQPVGAERKIILTYDDVKASVVIPPRGDEDPSPEVVKDLSTPLPGNISVVVTINAAGNANRPSNFGWLNFDIQHTYPREIAPRSADFGWEQTVIYPILRFSRQTASAFEPVITGPLQYSAIYTRTDSASAVNTATGLAIHVEDERGHWKFASYDAAQREFRYTLRNSIHLRGRDFVRPDSYTLTGGDDYGYGGNRMVYRLRAFRLEGACPGVPAGWHDVVGIYRDWLRARFRNDPASVFYDKIESVRLRPRNAPDDEMSPHTVIANYGLDGAVDPPTPPPPPGAPHLSRWLEMHPIMDGAPDIPGNTNDSVLDVLKRLRDKFPNSNPDSPVKLEVQVWGIEKAGFYQFICGFPQLTNVLSGNPQKFAQALKGLARSDIAVGVTTDPMCALFNRGRFAGHVRWKGTDWSQIADPATWEPFIKAKFPAAFSPGGCPVTHSKIGGRLYNRIWVVEHSPSIERVPNSPDAVALKRCQRTNQYGELQQHPPTSLGGGLHLATQKQLCPVAEAADIYVNRWVKPWLIEQGVRVVEFMKHNFHGYFCFRADHQHIVPHPHVTPRPGDPLMPPAAGAPYTNVIGYGSWHVRRLQCIFHDVHEAGKRFDADPFCSFRLSHEFIPVEALAPYIDQYWVSNDEPVRSQEIFNFVYSHLVTPLQTLLRDWGIHPGYKEARKTPGPNLVPPLYMLDKRRDTDPMPLPDSAGMTPEQLDGVRPDRESSFQTWRGACVSYFKENFKVVDFGVAPRAYPTGELTPGQPPAAWNPRDPLAPTNPPTYTYNRCVQDVFNLRAHIFENGLRAVMGERIMIPSPWLEEPLDYNDEAVNCLVRAAQLQMRFKEFFREGFMLGETRLARVNGQEAPGDLWAWGTARKFFRPFLDVQPLVHRITQDDPNFDTGWQQRRLRDFISKGWDRRGFADNSFNDIAFSPQIRHRIWQHGEGDARRLLYAFANVGNTAAHVVFRYGRGLEGIRQAAPWNRALTIISPNPPATLPDEPVWAHKLEPSLDIPARSFAAIVVRK